MFTGGELWELLVALLRIFPAGEVQDLHELDMCYHMFAECELYSSSL